MMKRVAAVLVSVLILLLSVSAPVSAELPSCAAMVLMEAQTGQVLYEEHMDEVRPMGTFAKLMTALLTAEAIGAGKCSVDTMLTAPAAVADCKGAVIWLVPGEKMSVGDLLSGLLIGNASDAAVTLAHCLSGDADTFVMDMNARAFELGMHDTRFASPSGDAADDAGLTTAYDLALLCRAVIGHTVLCERMTVWRTFLRGEATELVNENTLTRNFDGLLGLKAAHGSCGESICAAAQRGVSSYIAVALDCADADARFSAAKQLLAKGFAGYEITTPSFSDEFMRPLAVKHGTQSAVELKIDGLRGIVLPKQGGESAVSVVIPDYIMAPVRAGQAVGTVAFYSGDTLVYEAALVTAESVPRMTWRKAFVRLLGKVL
ncbi:MAG: D-alanyl-D-alanine carboxypeptidase [Ruminococcus sp.]|nr:D-alanyl-D-alanine carboxypeptidase [Ruminococcus sp.]